MNEPHNILEHLYLFLSQHANDKHLMKMMCAMDEDEQLKVMILINNGCPEEVIVKSFWQYIGICEYMEGEENDE